MNFSEFDIIKKIRNSTTAVRTYEEKELYEEGETLSRKEPTASGRDIGLDKECGKPSPSCLRTKPLLTSMRTTLAEMKVAHNKFVQEHGYSSELLVE